MCYLMFVTVSGLILFALVIEEAFSYKKLKTVNEIVNAKLADMEEYMYDISLVRKDKVIDLKYITEALEKLQESMRYSTRMYF